jgi:archaetidylinositol phosphate synthase
MAVGQSGRAGDFGGHRALDGVISSHERGLLEYLARRMPSRVLPDHLTALGVVGAALAMAGLIAANFSLIFLWLAVLGLALNWIGDSLDGTLARVRRIERARYGFFVDHVSDIASQFLIVLGLGLSPLMRFDIALLALLGYLALGTYTYIKLHVTRSMQLTYFGVGPTEVRVLIGAGLVLATLVELPWIATPFGRIGLFDGVAVILFAFAIGSGVAMFVRDARELALADPARLSPGLRTSDGAPIGTGELVAVDTILRAPRWHGVRGGSEAEPQALT